MDINESNHVLDVLRATLLRVESSTELRQDDLAVIELKRILLRRIRQELDEAEDVDAIQPGSDLRSFI